MKYVCLRTRAQYNLLVPFGKRSTASEASIVVQPDVAVSESAKKKRGRRKSNGKKAAAVVEEELEKGKGSDDWWCIDS